AGHQCARGIDSHVDPDIQRTAAQSVERPDKSGTGVCCRPCRQTPGRAATSGSGVHATESYVLACGLSAERLDTPSPGCEIAPKNGWIELNRRAPHPPTGSGRAEVPFATTLSHPP